jgi:hypothetical protein
LTLSDLGVNAQRNELVKNEYVDGCMGDKRKQIEIKRVFLLCICVLD